MKPEFCISDEIAALLINAALVFKIARVRSKLRTFGEIFATLTKIAPLTKIAQSGLKWRTFLPLKALLIKRETSAKLFFVDQKTKCAQF